MWNDFRGYGRVTCLDRGGTYLNSGQSKIQPLYNTLVNEVSFCVHALLINQFNE